MAIHQAKGFTVQVSLVPPKTYFCVFHGADGDLQRPFFIFDSQVYVDDFGGVEETKEKALESFHSLGNLLMELGLEEGLDKAQGDIYNKKSNIGTLCKMQID